MDPAAIGSAVVTILAPYFADAGKEMVKAAGDVGLSKARSLMAWLKEEFAKGDDPLPARDLERFEKNPEAYGESLKTTIEEKIRSEPSFGAALETQVSGLQPILTLIQRFKEGKHVVGVEADSMKSGDVNVTQEAGTVENMTGIRIKNLG
jgi:hypothetical protein